MYGHHLLQFDFCFYGARYIIFHVIWDQMLIFEWRNFHPIRTPRLTNIELMTIYMDFPSNHQIDHI